MSKNRSFQSLADFYPYYLQEHLNPINRGLHFVGTGLVIAIVFSSIIGGRWSNLLVAPLIGYGFAWIGHFGFEKNRPATFRHPIYSFICDFRMFFDLARGKLAFRTLKPHNESQLPR